MLTLYHNGQQHIIQDTEYYIRELANGLDEVIFNLSIYDPIYAILAEEENIVDRAGQTYKVKQIDGGSADAKIICQLDIDAWRASLHVGYNSGSKTVAQQIEAICPAGWTVVDRSNISIRRTIEGDYTPYEVCVRCTEVYNVYIRWDNKNRVCTIYTKEMAPPVGAFATHELNLKELNYKGKSNDLITRLYCYGKDNLTIEGATIEGQTYPYPYVENLTYTNKVICGIWRDERYTVAEDLYNDAVEKLKTMSKPDRTYECSIVDLQATNPELYQNLDFSLYTTAALIDDIKETEVDYQVVERHIYPYHPDLNEVIFNSEPLKITASVVNIVESLDNPSSNFNQIQAQRIAAATNWLLSGDGYVVAVKGPNGEWKELLFMDNNDMALAQKVLRINENGIGFSKTGVNGPYTNAWTIDGQLVADFITTGTMLANRIRGGYLELGGLNNDDGVLLLSTYASLKSGTWSTGYEWCNVSALIIGHAVSVDVDILISNITTPSDYDGYWTLLHTTDGGSTWTSVKRGSLPEGTTKIKDIQLSSDPNDYYSIGIYQDNGTSPFDYNFKCNKIFTTIDNNGLNINNNFTVDPSGAMVASNVDVTGGKLAGLDIEYAEKGLSYNAKISGVSCYFKVSAWGGFTSGRQLSNSWARMDYVAEWGMLKVDYGGSSSSMKGIYVTAAGNNTYNDPGSSYAYILADGIHVVSDRRSKKDIRDLEDVEFILRIRPVAFKYVEGDTERDHFGFIAQEVQEELPDNNGVVEENKLLSMNYQELIAPLIKTVQNQQKQINELKEELKKIKEAVNG